MGCSNSTLEDDRDTAGHTLGGARAREGFADEAAAIISGPGLTSRVHLSLSCKGLANVDIGSLSDPFVVVYMKCGGESLWSEIGRTEVVANSLNPMFVTLVPAVFRFEEVQHLKFHVYDVDGDFFTSSASELRLSEQTSLGHAECALGNIMGAHGQTFTQALESPDLPGQRATITVRAEQAMNSNDLVKFEIAAKATGSHASRLNSVFARFSRTTEQGEPVPCFKTEVVQGVSGECRWKECNVGLPILANGDPHRPLVVELWSYQRSGSHTFLASCKLCVDDMRTRAGTGRGFPLSDMVGELTVLSCKLQPQPSFFDYLAGGLQIQITVAIDYTASNGDPNMASSLHHHDPSGRTMNQYAQAISSVGSILEYYDADKRFPVLGFGGCPVPNEPAQHRFAVNGNELDPEVEGVDGILACYRQSLRWVQLSGPTLFAPVISQAVSVAASLRSNDPTQQTYSVLLLLTDGVIHDMDNTKDALVRGADQPFSVIIIGVGDEADFGPMEELDGDEVRIKDYTGKPASRDIVQFVPMKDFRQADFHSLAREVLAEIPAQVVEYMNDNGIKPCPPKKALNRIPR